MAGWKSYIFHFCKIICLLFLNFMAICGDIYDVIKTYSDMFNLYQIVVLLCTADLFFCQMWYNSSIKADKLFNSIIAMHLIRSTGFAQRQGPLFSRDNKIFSFQIFLYLPILYSTFFLQVVLLRISMREVRWILKIWVKPEKPSHIFCVEYNEYVLTFIGN